MHIGKDTLSMSFIDHLTVTCVISLVLTILWVRVIYIPSNCRSERPSVLPKAAQLVSGWALAFSIRTHYSLMMYCFVSRQLVFLYPSCYRNGSVHAPDSIWCLIHTHWLQAHFKDLLGPLKNWWLMERSSHSSHRERIRVGRGPRGHCSSTLILPLRNP